MAKLTLNVDPAVVARAKRLAASRGTSVSKMVETLLHLAVNPREASRGTPPVLAKLRGSLRGLSSADYRHHLEAKHR